MDNIASQSKLRGDCFNYQRYARTNRYRKRYPSHKRSALHANAGIENDTHHASGTHRTNMGIENDTQLTGEAHPRKHRYRKRYPAHKKNAPTQAQVSKTIPGSREWHLMACGLSALNGIEWHLMAAQSKGLLNNRRFCHSASETSDCHSLPFSDHRERMPFYCA